MKSFSKYIAIILFVVVNSFSSASAYQDTSIVIEGVYNPAKSVEDTFSAKFGELIALQITGVANLKKIQDNLPKKNLILFVNGIPLTSVRSLNIVPIDRDPFIFSFRLERNDTTEHIWDYLSEAVSLPSPWSDHNGRIGVSISAGFDDGRIFATREEIRNKGKSINNFSIVLYKSGWLKFLEILSIVLIVFIVYLCMKTSIIKTKALSGQYYYSLAKSQFLAWSILIAIAFALLFIVTGSMPLLPPSVLILLGISIGTTGIATLIKNNSLNDPNTVSNAGKSEGFILDIISDNNGPSVSRIQNVIFTIILMMIFAIEVLSNYAMPNFTTTMLALMGVSAAGYLSLKPNEDKESGSSSDSKNNVVRDESTESGAPAVG